MNRRSFLHMLGIGAAAASTTVYFDMGKNLYRIHEPVFYTLTDLKLDLEVYQKFYAEIVMGIDKQITAGLWSEKRLLET